MKVKRIIIGVVLIPIAIWIYFTMEKESVKYFGAITLFVIGSVVLILGFKKESKVSLAPPEPMKPDEHTPGYKPDYDNQNHDNHKH
ncbi:MAG: hypothetical protein WC693_02875 [Patescibacteria group bacterium]|jgi:hypothetical protein